MPQININEIDQSIFTRVITDDYVRVFVPGIASFGPSVDSSSVDFNDITFTDVQEFRKTFGYTEPEYNPFKNDVSRMYAEQLIRRGAAVTFLRINSGAQATYDLGRTETNGVSKAATHSPGYNETSVNPSYKFCPQIESITAKYTGSFGNRLLVTFTPITSQNRNFAYQYSMVTVYRADVKNVSSTDSEGKVTVKPVITGVHKLESHLVTTNPDDANYFGDVEFKYIVINPTVQAYDELSLIWSNLSESPEKDTTVYSGFPEITLKYVENNILTYNSDALLTLGTDFIFDDDLNNAASTISLMDILGKGFGGYDVNNSSTKTTTFNINRWIWASYKPEGVVDTVLTALKNCYENYTDPYIYDFDFITSGGFLDETYTIQDLNNYVLVAEKPSDWDTSYVNYFEKVDDSYVAVTGTTAPTWAANKYYTNSTVIATEDDVLPYIDSTNSTKKETVLTAISDRKSEIPATSVQSIHLQMKNLVETRQDCIALFDVGPYWTADEIPSYVNLLNTSYGAVHAPWCYCNNPNATGTILMPPSFVFLYTLLSNLINNTEAQKWFPPAGVTRATARIVKKPLYEIGSVLLDKWQNDTLSRVNPIMKLKNYGYVIYGQYTTYTAQDEYTHSALESLNVRLISNCVKKQIFNTCIKLTFEPNNSTLWMKFYDAMDKYLLFMKRNDGVYDYRIQMDESTVTTDDINELRCPGKVWINPVRAAEFFDIDFILTEAGVTFTDTTEEGE